MTNEKLVEAVFAEFLCLLFFFGVGGLGYVFCNFLRGDD